MGAWDFRPAKVFVPSNSSSILEPPEKGGFGRCGIIFHSRPVDSSKRAKNHTTHRGRIPDKIQYYGVSALRQAPRQLDMTD